MSDEFVINKYFNYYFLIYCRFLLFIDVVKVMVVWGVYVFEGGKGLMYFLDVIYISMINYLLYCIVLVLNDMLSIR